MKNKKSLHNKIVKVCLSESEYQYILEACSHTGLSLSAFFRNVALGTPLPNKSNITSSLELLKFSSDLGRLGGLLKMAISNGMEKYKVEPLLKEIRQRQAELKALVDTIKNDK